MKRVDVVFSGMRPFVDWHMLTTGYDDTSKLQENCREKMASSAIRGEGDGRQDFPSEWPA